MDDFDDFDDWSETGEWDSSDTWDDVDEVDPEAEDPDDAYGLWEAEEDWEDVELDAGGGSGGDLWVSEGATVAASAGGGGMSAWEAGTAFALGGWLLDRHAERIAAAIREQGGVATQPASSLPPPPGHPPAPAWRSLTEPPIDLAAPPMQPGAFLNPSTLAVLIAQRLREGRELGMEATPSDEARRRPPPHGLDWSALKLTVMVTSLVPDRPVWVMFEETPRGFTTVRLLPVFADVGPPGRAYCFTDDATAAARVVVWGLERFGLAPIDFAWTSGG